MAFKRLFEAIFALLDPSAYSDYSLIEGALSLQSFRRNLQVRHRTEMRRQLLGTAMRYRSPAEVVTLNTKPASYAQFKAMRSPGAHSSGHSLPLQRRILT